MTQISPSSRGRQRHRHRQTSHRHHNPTGCPAICLASAPCRPSSQTPTQRLRPWRARQRSFSRAISWTNTRHLASQLQRVEVMCSRVGTQQPQDNKGKSRPRLGNVAVPSGWFGGCCLLMPARDAQPRWHGSAEIPIPLLGRPVDDPEWPIDGESHEALVWNTHLQRSRHSSEWSFRAS